jgi:hypothetical protein
MSARMPAPLEQRVEAALSDVRFPVARWRLLAQADHNGADILTRTQLRALPPGEYRSLAKVIHALGHSAAPPG